MQSDSETKKDADRAWEKIVMKYNHPDLFKSIWQIINSVIPFILVYYFMYRSLEYSYVYTLLLAVLASGFLIRIFIIFHDCGHRSFFKTKKANDIVGKIMGILVFTPYSRWNHQHAIHHATSGNLDKRGIGDVWTMTVEEYKNATPKQRFSYRAYRNPFIMFLLGPILMILIQNRITKKNMTSEHKRNVYFTNIMIVVTAGLVSLLIGLKSFLLIQIPILMISHSIGIWLFYVQHQFDDVEWERQSKWDYKLAAIKGSSFLKLPAIFQWFTGNIGFHHVHHLSSRIPNYKLAKCHYENEIFKNVTPVLLLSTFRAITLGLWDETNHVLVSFRKIHLPQLKPGGLTFIQKKRVAG
jgi:omega-6 fatty acid desaturase (delta-12 desaturase)